MQMMLEKEGNLGDVTTGIKAGGKIHGVICFKKDSTKELCTAESGVTAFTWAEEPKEEEEEKKDETENKEEKDSASSMAVYGASLLAAISALAF